MKRDDNTGGLQHASALSTGLRAWPGSQRPAPGSTGAAAPGHAGASARDVQHHVCSPSGAPSRRLEVVVPLDPQLTPRQRACVL